MLPTRYKGHDQILGPTEIIKVRSGIHFWHYSLNEIEKHNSSK